MNVKKRWSVTIQETKHARTDRGEGWNRFCQQPIFVTIAKYVLSKLKRTQFGIQFAADQSFYILRMSLTVPIKFEKMKIQISQIMI